MYILKAIILTLTLLSLATPATAQMVCGDHDTLVDILNKDHTEVRTGSGLAEGQMLIEIFVSEDTGSWTILSTTPEDIACIMAVGHTWEQDAPALPGDPA